MFDKYAVKLTLIRPMLGTNPCDPHILDTHILQRQRKLILEKNTLNIQINKYLDQIPISKEKGEKELEKLLDSLEKLIGRELSIMERENAIRGELDSLRETFQELDLRATTIFLWDDKTDMPCIGDHMIHGFLKAAVEAIGRTVASKRGEVFGSISYTQSLINQHVRCEEQFIPFDKDISRKEDGTPQYDQRSLRAQTAQGPRITLAKSEVVPAGASLSFTLKVLKGSKLTQEVLEKLFSYGECVGLGQWRSSGRGMFKYELSPVT